MNVHVTHCGASLCKQQASNSRFKHYKLRWRSPKQLINYSWASTTEKRAVTPARYFLRPWNSRRGWTGLRYTWAKLIVVVKFCQAWNYTAVAVSRRAVFGVLFLRQVLLAVRSFWPYIQHDRIVWTHVQGQSVKSSPGKLLSESKRVCGREVAEKTWRFWSLSASSAS